MNNSLVFKTDNNAFTFCFRGYLVKEEKKNHRIYEKEARLPSLPQKDESTVTAGICCWKQRHDAEAQAAA
jgi:hypothetical protein